MRLDEDLAVISLGDTCQCLFAHANNQCTTTAHVLEADVMDVK